MLELWYSILVFMITTYIVMDGWNFGAGILHLFVARTPAERRQVISAMGPLWSWHEVWLVGFGGTMFVAFPRLMAAGFSGYYLALFLILWCLLLRGVSVEVGGHIDDRMWQTFWDSVFFLASVLLSILFGVALGNVARGVPLDSTGEFHMAFFTNFSVRGYVGLLDWYTISVGVVCHVILMAHGATYLILKTEGPVHDRAVRIARWVWSIIPFFFVLISVETWVVRPQLLPDLVGHPLAWIGILVFLIGAGALFTGLREGLEKRAFTGSCMIMVGLLEAGAAAIFPVFLFSTLKPEDSLTVYNTASSMTSLELALIWWPISLVMAFTYFWFIIRHYSGKVKLSTDTQGYY
jgi:cytochrome d ubiquinol oxidase subunit II